MSMPAVRGITRYFSTHGRGGEGQRENYADRWRTGGRGRAGEGEQNLTWPGSLCLGGINWCPIYSPSLLQAHFWVCRCTSYGKISGGGHSIYLFTSVPHKYPVEPGAVPAWLPIVGLFICSWCGKNSCGEKGPYWFFSESAPMACSLAPPRYAIACYIGFLWE